MSLSQLSYFSNVIIIKNFSGKLNKEVLGFLYLNRCNGNHCDSTFTDPSVTDTTKYKNGFSLTTDSVLVSRDCNHGS